MRKWKLQVRLSRIHNHLLRALWEIDCLKTGGISYYAYVGTRKPMTSAFYRALENLADDAEGAHLNLYVTKFCFKGVFFAFLSRGRGRYRTYPFEYI